MVETFLVPENTIVAAKGDGPGADIREAANRVFLLDLKITGIVEQEAIEVSIFGSVDGTNWEPKPLASFPQKFYVGHYALLLDLTEKPAVKVLRAHWETLRWGRGPETPKFEFQLSLKEVPAEMLASR
jgi:hypothetical protein